MHTHVQIYHIYYALYITFSLLKIVNNSLIYFFNKQTIKLFSRFQTPTSYSLT